MRAAITAIPIYKIKTVMSHHVIFLGQIVFGSLTFTIKQKDRKDGDPLYES